ncbi:YdcF family protein [Anaerolineae bacterium CFX9]|nr:YdcF family protein [Anaerolineae bacterium CFX9]
MGQHLPMRQVTFRSILKHTFRFMVIFGLIWLIAAGVLAAGVYAYSLADRAPPSDVIIVLGAGLRRDSRPGPALYRRTSRALELYAEGYAPVIICTGGFTAGRTRSEADACRELLVAGGVPENVILLEERSRSTEENAFYAREIMDANGWQSAVVVSDGYHLLRAQWIFSQEGIEVSTSPSPGPGRLALASAIGREVLALHWQLFKDALNLPVTYVAFA